MSLTPNCTPLDKDDLTPEQWDELSKSAHNLLMSADRKQRRKEYFENMMNKIIKNYCNKDEQKQLENEGVYKRRSRRKSK